MLMMTPVTSFTMTTTTTTVTSTTFSRLRLSLDELLLFSELFQVDDNFLKLITINEDRKTDQDGQSGEQYRINANQNCTSVILHTNQMEQGSGLYSWRLSEGNKETGNLKKHVACPQTNCSLTTLIACNIMIYIAVAPAEAATAAAAAHQWHFEAPIGVEYEKVRLCNNMSPDCLQVAQVYDRSICAAPIPVWQPSSLVRTDQTKTPTIEPLIGDDDIGAGNGDNSPCHTTTTASKLHSLARHQQLT